MVRVLILGGTAEARELAAALHAGGADVTSSLAGRVRTPGPVAGAVRIGGFGGADGLAAHLEGDRVDVVVDATHPFAQRISAAAATACARTDIPLLVLRRPGWSPRPGDRWHWVDDLAGAAATVAGLGCRALLTTGRQELAPFAGIDDVWFLVRSIEPPQPPLPPRHEVLLARGPFTVAGELALMDEHRIDVVVTKDSGGATAKLDAARARGLPVLLVRRPPTEPGVPTVAAVTEAARWALSAGSRPAAPTR